MSPHTLRSLLLKYLISSCLQCRGVRQSGGQLDLVQLYPRLIEGQLSAEASQMKRRQAALSPSSPTVCLGGRLGADGMNGCLVLTVPVKGHFRQVCQSSDGKSSQGEQRLGCIHWQELGSVFALGRGDHTQNVSSFRLSG